MKKFLKVIAILVLMIFGLGSCVGSTISKGTIKQLRASLNYTNFTKEEAEKRVSELETELKNKTLEANSAAQKLTEITAGSSNSYLDIKFPSDGNYYVDSYQSTFYKDENCTQPINAPRFMSPVIDENLTAPNGFSIQAIRLDTGELCYCPKDTRIYLVTEEEWQE